ncbi:hypothetical protein PAXRUDRAFT_139919, partial [Paxillus rubicundulus Ve08.2h10]
GMRADIKPKVCVSCENAHITCLEPGVHGLLKGSRKWETIDLMFPWGGKDQMRKRQKSFDYMEKWSEDDIGEGDENQPDEAEEENVDALGALTEAIASFSTLFDEHCKMTEA